MTPKQIEAELAAREKWQAKNWSVEGLHESALQAIRGLYARAANDGDPEAAHALADLGNYVSQALAFDLKQTPEGTPGFEAVSRAAADSYLWPAVLPAMEEMRDHAAQDALPGNLGENLPVRVAKRKGKGRTRDFVNAGQTGFAFNVFCSLEAQRDKSGLPDFTSDNLTAWISAGLVLVASRPDLFPDTVELKSAIDARISKAGVGEDNARKYVIETRLEKGFRQLLRD